MTQASPSDDGTERVERVEHRWATVSVSILVLLVGIKLPWALFLGVLLLLTRQFSYGLQLTRNHYPFSFIVYYVPAVVLYAGVLWASYRSHVAGRVTWKGREYQMAAPGSVEK